VSDFLVNLSQKFAAGTVDTPTLSFFCRVLPTGTTLCNTHGLVEFIHRVRIVISRNYSCAIHSALTHVGKQVN
jgi:hypothetical protein